MDLLVNGMARAMQKVLTIPCLRDRPSSFLVNLPPIENLARRIPGLYGLYCCVAAITDDIEYLLMFRGNSLTNEERPCDVVIDGMRCPPLGPHVYQQKIAFFHWKIVASIRCVVRIGAVVVNRDDRRVSGGEVVAIHLLEYDIQDRHFF